LEQQISQWHKSDERSRKLEEVPGIGLIRPVPLWPASVTLQPSDMAAAAPRCAPDTPAQWLAQQQACHKQSDVAAVLAALAPYLEAPEVTDKVAPVRCCSRYLTNRPGQFEYQQALVAGCLLARARSRARTAMCFNSA